MPQEYWDFWKHEPPALKMGTRERPKSWRIGFNGPPGGGKSCSMAYMTPNKHYCGYSSFHYPGIVLYPRPDSLGR